MATNKLFIWLRNLAGPVFDPIHSLRGLVNYFGFFRDWRRYSGLPKAEPIRWTNLYPQLHDRTVKTAIDTHYFYTNGWAMRRILSTSPDYHVDVASQTMFVNLLGSVASTFFVDYRPLTATMPGLYSLGGNLMCLPFATGSVASLSCLHVVEHIGLGRYGDPLDPQGTYKAIRELVRVLAPGGNLFLSTPVGRPRVCFNAHRIHAAQSVRMMAGELELIEFSGVSDDGCYLENQNLNSFDHHEYACGFFWLRRAVE